MNTAELEKLFAQLNVSFRKEGGSVFGITGISRLDYFAAMAPAAPLEWIEDFCKDGKRTSVEAMAEWAWVYARRMIAQKPQLEDPGSEGMYVVTSVSHGKVYARASTRARAQTRLEEVAKDEMTNATSFQVEGPFECPTCGHGSPGAGSVARPQ